MYKLLSLDLDGTLLSSDKDITEENIKALSYANDKNILVVFNTGRLYKSALRYVNKIPFNVPLICCNGSAIFDGNGKFIKSFKLEDACVEKIFAITNNIEGLDVNFTDENANVLYSETFECNIKATYEQNRKLCKDERTEIVLVPDAIKHIKNNSLDIVKIVLQGSDDNLNGAYDLVKMIGFINVDKYRNSLEITSAGVNKLSGLSYLCNELGIELGECISIGDSVVDMSMVEGSGLGVAVGNADDELKKHSCCVTKNDNNNSAVAEAIYRFIG